MKNLENAIIKKDDDMGAVQAPGDRDVEPDMLQPSSILAATRYGNDRICLPRMTP